MGDVDEVYGVWKNLNHPYIEVEDTAVAVVKFKSGAVGNIVVSNSQNPALYGKVHVFGENGAGVGVQTDGGAMFIAGMSTITEPPYNDLWTVEARPTIWRTGRRATATSSTAWTPCTTTIRSRSRTSSTPWRPTLSLGGRPRRPQDRGAVRGHLLQHPDQLRRQISHPLRWAKRSAAAYEDLL